MSINAMANAAIDWRLDYLPQGCVPKTATERAQTASKDPTSANTLTTAITTLTTYIPTETLTLYVAFIAVIQPANGNLTTSFTYHWIAFWLFLLFTPFTA